MATLLALLTYWAVCRIFWFAGLPAFLVLFGLTTYCAAVLICIGFMACRRWKKTPKPSSEPRPGVTILKPLCGLDDELAANLESFLKVEYDPVEILFGVKDPDDPALALAREVAARYPNRDVKFAAGITSDATNPKIAIDENLLKLAKHPLVLLSDSNVRMDVGDLSFLVEPLSDDQVGMVYQPVVFVGEQDCAAAVQNLRFTELTGVLTVAARPYAGTDVITGKGMLCRRSALSSIGDLSQVRDVGLDDYLLGVHLKNAGWRLYLSEIPAVCICVHGSWRAFFDRQLRHAVWRFSLYRLLPLAELALSPLVWVAAAVLVGGPHAWSAAFLAMAAKILAENLGTRWLRSTPFSWRHSILIPLKDALVVAIWMMAILRTTVIWRNRSYQVGRWSRLHPIES